MSEAGYQRWKASWWAITLPVATSKRMAGFAAAPPAARHAERRAAEDERAKREMSRMLSHPK